MTINSYWLGYSVGYWQRRLRPRLNIQYIRGYLAGLREQHGWTPRDTLLLAVLLWWAILYAAYWVIT